MSRVVALIVLFLAATPLAAQGPSSVCKDGTASGASGRGACSGHGGVDVKATSAAAKAAATKVTCTDGANSAGGRGACSGHGGIAMSTSVEKKHEAAAKKADTGKPAARVAAPSVARPGKSPR